jgi:hypothetical protein
MIRTRRAALSRKVVTCLIMLNQEIKAAVAIESNPSRFGP